MSCSVTISGATGTTIAGTIVSIQVTGTAFDCASGKIDVSLVCPGGETITLGVLVDSNGNWTANFQNFQSCQCDAPVTVMAQCSGNSACSATPLNVPALQCHFCCDFEVPFSVDPDCVDGKRQVVFSVYNNCGVAINGTLNFGDGNQTSSTFLPGPNTVTYFYPPGTYNAVLNILGCSGIPITVTVQPCPACCDVQLSVLHTDCQNGKRLVTFQIDNHCQAAINGGILDFGDTSQSPVPIPLGTSIVTHIYTTPGTYPATLQIPNCNPIPVSVTVAPCPCCQVQASATVDLHCTNDKRVVTFTFTSNCQAPITGATLDFDDGTPVASVPINPGPNTFAHLYAPGNYNPTLKIPGCPDIKLQVSVAPCPPCCNVQLSGTVDTKCHNGQRDVIFDIVNDCGVAITGASISFDNSSQSPVSVPNGASHLTYSFSPGPHTATLFIPGCPGIAFHFNVDACDPCPTIVISHTIGDCNPDGTRPVTVTAIITGASSTSPITGQMTGPCPTVTNTGVGSLTLTGSCSLNTGGYIVSVIANNCPAQTHSFSVEDCCPTVDFDHVVLGSPLCVLGDCREVKVTATVKPHNGVQTTATLQNMPSGTVLATGTGSVPFTLSHTECYPDGTQQVQVSFAAPLNCPPQPYSFCVPKCETVKCFMLRHSMMFALTVFLSIALMNAIVAAVTSVPWFLAGRYQDYLSNPPLQSALNSMMALWLVVAIVLFFIWFLCIKFFGIQLGSCCGTRCTLLLTLWQVPVMVGTVLLYFLAVSWLPFLIAALILFLIAYLFFNWWKAACCPGRCDPGFYLAFALGFALVQVIIIIDSTAPGLTATCVAAPYTLSVYPALFIIILWVITLLLRLIIAYVFISYLLATIMCVQKRD